ncbi:MAG: DUF393 domain-containing protein [Pseudomonadota bacterium]
MSSDQTRILYNADCPVCNFEISHYARYAQRHDLPIGFDDLNRSDLAEWGITADEAARRLYVKQNGQMYGGVDAFVVLWAEMPRYRRVSGIVGHKAVRPVAAWVYDRVLAPAIYWMHVRRQIRQRANHPVG